MTLAVIVIGAVVVEIVKTAVGVKVTGSIAGRIIYQVVQMAVGGLLFAIQIKA